MRLLVCGGRSYGEIPAGCPSDQIAAYRLACGRAIFLLRETLDHLHDDLHFTDLIHGAAKGADRHALQWALPKGLTINEFCPDWKKLGKAAGPIRNQQMLDIGKPDLVVAFPGGAGTADMVKRARAANIRVIEI